MSDVEETPVEGTVDNGATALVSLKEYTGRAGVKRYGDSVEVAYRGNPPRKLPAPIRVGTQQMIATERNTNTSPGFVVLVAIDDPAVDS